MTAVVRGARGIDARGRLDSVAWEWVTTELDAHGCAVLEHLLSPEDCATLAALYPHHAHFRSRG